MNRAARPHAPEPPAPPADAPAPAVPSPLAFGLVAVLATVLAVLAFGPHAIADYYAETDFLGGYAGGALGLLAGRVDVARYAVTGPVYEFTLAAFAALTRDVVVAGKLVAIAAACATVLLWFRLLERRAGTAVALWTTLFLAANPTFVRYGSSLTTDTLACATQAAALYAMFGRHGPRSLPWAGALAALAALTRFNAIVLLPAALACDAVREAPGFRARVGALARFAAGFAALALPWLAFSLAGGHVPGEGLIHDFAFGAFAQGKGVSWDEYAARMQPGFRTLGDVLAHDPGTLAARLWGNLGSHAVLDVQRVLRLPAAIACAAGVVCAVLERGGTSWRRLLPLWAAGALLYLSLVPVFHSERYSLALVPFALSLAGIAVASAPFAWRAWHRPEGVSVKWALGLVALAAAVTVCVRDQREVLARLPLEVRPAAAALRTGTGGDPTVRVLARKPHLAFYAGATHVPFPVLATLPELAAFCRTNRIAYVYFSVPEAEMRPELSFLLDRDADVPGLEPVRFDSPRPARLYKVGAGLGTRPDWFGNDSLRTLRVSRALEDIGTPRWRVALVCGLYAMSEQDAAAAARHFEALIEARPDFAQGHFLAAQSWRALGRLEPAIDRYRHALALEPDRAEAWEGLGWSLLAAGDVPGAAGAWRPIVSRVSDPGTLGRMLWVFERSGDAPSAEIARAALARHGGGTR